MMGFSGTYSACPLQQTHPKCSSSLLETQPSHQHQFQLIHLTHWVSPSPSLPTDSMSLLLHKSMGICLEGNPTCMYVSHQNSQYGLGSYIHLKKLNLNPLRITTSELQL